jgi:hypothetical protein
LGVEHCIALVCPGWCVTRTGFYLCGVSTKRFALELDHDGALLINIESCVMSARLNEDFLLHVVPLNTGGVDRFVRDVCTIRRQDHILHVGAEETVLELVASREFFVFETAKLISSRLFTQRSAPRAVYAHSTLDPVRSVVLQLCRSFSSNFVVSLHDIDFVGDGVVDNERAARHAFVRAAYARFAPSRFIANEARRVLPTVPLFVIENGVGRDALSPAKDYPVDMFKPPTRFATAVVGALGEHKGLSFLRNVAEALPDDEKVILVGYADGQLEPGWLIPDRVWMTGVFEPKDLRAIFEAAATKLVFFPNRQPESYSYALSDSWIAGCAALVPDVGALCERINVSGAGWTYSRDASAQEVVREILLRLDEASTLSGQIREATSALLTAEQMVEAIEAELPITTKLSQASRLNSVGLKPLNSHLPEKIATRSALEPHLSTTLMREEIRKLLAGLTFSQQALGKLEEQLKILTKNYESRGDWIDKLGLDLESITADNRVLNQKIADEHKLFSQAQTKYERDIGMLQAALRQIESAVERTAWPARPLLRRWLTRK